MIELRKFLAPEFVFGEGAIHLAGQYARNFSAQKVLVVTDSGVILAGWADKVTKSLESSGINYSIYHNVSPNPRAEEVMEGADYYHSEGCDIIIAVGGGSAIDCAKGIGIVSTNKKNILEFEGVDNVSIPGPPLICIPTTSGTSADVSQFDIITNSKDKIKIAIISKAMVPDVALIDPSTALTMDTYLTACTGIDAFVHAIEAFVSTASSPITDLHALEAIKLIHENLLKVINNPNDIILRSKIMFASLQAGLAFSNASLGAVHAMAHSLGGYLDLPHGECNSILIDHVVAFNYKEANDRFNKIGDVLKLDLTSMTSKEKQKAVLEEITRFKIAAGISSTLSKKGVSISDIPELSKKALCDPCIVTNPRRPNKRDIEVIYEEAI
ncbi:MAG: iron-containing alcohol dehydrogenase [Desulfobacterales bacterium]|nr:iron-containing alcohol dehydrogenase [Desulfobacterales bacterium]